MQQLLAPNGGEEILLQDMEEQVEHAGKGLRFVGD